MYLEMVQSVVSSNQMKGIVTHKEWEPLKTKKKRMLMIGKM